MEGQPPTEPPQYLYQSAQWSRLVQRNTVVNLAFDTSSRIIASPRLQSNFDLVPILLPQQSTFHQAQLAQYNKFIASARTARIQALPLAPILSPEHIEAVCRQRPVSNNVNTDQNTKTASRGGHGNRDARKSTKGERALIIETGYPTTMPAKKLDLCGQLPMRPSVQHQHSMISQQSNSVPSTPHQHARNFSFESREPSPNATNGHSPRSAYSESDSKLITLRPSQPRLGGGCRYETGQASMRRRVRYDVGSERLERLDLTKIKSKLSKDEERTLSTDMRELYDRLLPTPESDLKRRKLVQKLEQLLNQEWPGHDIQVHVFGSSGNLLCTDESDVDICITTEWKQLEEVCMIAELLAKSGMEKVVCVSNAKVPIVKIWDPELSLACDMNVNNPLALENTRMIKTYVEIDSRVRPLAMIIKHWTKQRILNDAAFGGTLSSYTWICMIINFLQTRDPPVLPALHQRPHLKLPSKDGHESEFADDVEALKDLGQKNTETLGELLFHFFRFYGHEFDYDELVVSVRSGKQITKAEKNWTIGTNNLNLCVEEPFNVGRNLGNTADDTSFRGIHLELRRAFDLISEAKLRESCEKYEFPKEEEKEKFYERRPAKTPVVVSRSASQSNRGGRNSHRGRHSNQHGRNSNNRRSSGGAFDNNPGYISLPSNHLIAQEQWLQQQAQAQLHNELYTKYTVLQQEEIRLRQYQAYQQQQAAQQAQAQAFAQQNSKSQSRTPQQNPDRSRTTSIDQPPLTAPIRPEMYFYPLQYQQGPPIYAYQGPSTNPPSPSMSSAPPELRRSAHRSTVTNGSSPGTAQSSSAMRSHSQPATRSGASPLAVPRGSMQDQMHGLGLYQTMQYTNGHQVPTFVTDENVDTSPARSIPAMRAEDPAPKEYVGYYVNNSNGTFPRRQPQSSLAIPAFGDLNQTRRRLSTDQFPQSVLDRINRTSRSPSPLGDGRRDRSSSVDTSLIGTPASTAAPQHQHNVSSSNLRALNGQGPLVVNGSNIPMPSIVTGWQTAKSDNSASEDHGSDLAIGSYSSVSQGSDIGSELSGDHVFSGQSTPKTSRNGDRVEQPMVVNGSLPIPRTENNLSANGPSIPNGVIPHQHDPFSTNGLMSPEQPNGTFRHSPNTQRANRQAQAGIISPLDLGFNHSDTLPHLSPVYETRTPSPTANRKFDHASERSLNGNSSHAKASIPDLRNAASKLVSVNGSQPKPSSADTNSNGHIRASKSEGGGLGSWQKASKQKRKGQSTEQRSSSNGQQYSEKPPYNESERKGG
ncbi:hypothetical protein BP6252_11580 [Coleophoma cylindrospora]|uniref:polynucleotide adenylyltransferase n=1 Tax=Coleophoma cylindrospora TaxID=1849047 RepID=A0A3D8QK68_9HELO|nr:hypothetical protein BP6252_11580 [Coleophoma cylindrospora]